VVVVFLLSIASLIIYFIDSSTSVDTVFTTPLIHLNRCVDLCRVFSGFITVNFYCVFNFFACSLSIHLFS